MSPRLVVKPEYLGFTFAVYTLWSKARPAFANGDCLGIIGMATLMAMFIGGGMGIRTRLAAQVDKHVTSIGDVGPLFKRVAITMFSFQAITAIYLTFRYHNSYFDSWGEAA